MAEDNVQIVHELLDRWKRGDAALDLFAEDSVFDYTSFPDGRIVQGHDQIAEFIRSWVGTWDEYELIVDDVVGAGDLVVALTRERGRGRGSDARVELAGSFVLGLRDGKIATFKGYLDRAKALAAAGLT
jgi:ketosteroid isomerase-like protein